MDFETLVGLTEPGGASSIRAGDKLRKAPKRARNFHARYRERYLYYLYIIYFNMCLS